MLTPIRIGDRTISWTYTFQRKCYVPLRIVSGDSKNIFALVYFLFLPLPWLISSRKSINLSKPSCVKCRFAAINCTDFSKSKKFFCLLSGNKGYLWKKGIIIDSKTEGVVTSYEYNPSLRRLIMPHWKYCFITCKTVGSRCDTLKLNTGCQLIL